MQLASEVANMAAISETNMPLSAGDLNEKDKAILDALQIRSATPQVIKNMLQEEGIDVSRQYINRRLVRLREHGNVENLYDAGQYELVDDPRE